MKNETMQKNIFREFFRFFFLFKSFLNVFFFSFPRYVVIKEVMITQPLLQFVSGHLFFLFFKLLFIISYLPFGGGKISV